MVCPACGAPALEGDRFCRRCGRSLPEAAPAAEQPADPAAAYLGLPPPSPPARRRRSLAGSTLALLLIAAILLLGATNPSPSAYVAWAARRLVAGTTFVPVRDAAYLAVERATVADSYGVCTVFQTSLSTGTMTVLGIMGQFLPIGPGLPTAPLPPRRRRRRNPGGVQI